MDFKWLKNANQFEANDGTPGGGGAESAPTDGGSGPPPPAESTGGDAGAAGDGVAPTPSGAPTTTEEITHIAAPSSTKDLFKPAAEEYVPPYNDPGPAAPAAPEVPAKVDAPSKDEWDLDPGAAAVKQQQHMDWKIYNETAPLKETIASRNEADRRAYDADFQRKSMEVQHAARECEKAVDGFWAPTSVLNRDEAYRGNPEIQKVVETTINACVARALEVADQTANTARLHDITNNPKFLQRILHMAKGEVETPDPTIRPSAMPAGAQAPTGAGGDILDDEDQAALKESQKEGWGYTAEQLRAAKAATGGGA